jgi:hypothetical protein
MKVCESRKECPLVIVVDCQNDADLNVLVLKTSLIKSKIMEKQFLMNESYESSMKMREKASVE